MERGVSPGPQHVPQLRLDDLLSQLIERAQEAGGILAERDAGAEAWLFLSAGLLKMISRRLGGLVEDDFPSIIASRRLWLTGRADTDA